MDTERIQIFKKFARHLEYPMAVFEAESGRVLDMNNEAKALLGENVKTLHVEPGRALTTIDFWKTLHEHHSLMWHRLCLIADGEEHLISGLINEAVVENTQIYTLMFEHRANLNVGSLTLGQIVDHAGIVALHLANTEEGLQVGYISQNVKRFGYTREQFYEGKVEIGALICKEDYEGVTDAIEDAVKDHANEVNMECRISTDELDLIPVRLLVHMIYAEKKLTDLEILVLDLREELKRNRENRYLSTAISKMKSVVLVKSYCAGKRKLRYVSPNAGIVGMNVEALRKGYRLTEDYIHPEDRDSVIDAIYQAVANGITDYVQNYRMVRDDGKQIWVENSVTVNRISDGEAEISFLLTDITEQKEMERELAVATEEVREFREDVEEKQSKSVIDLITIDQKDVEMLEQLQLMADTLSRKADYYSVVLDAEGQLLTRPAGPMDNIGQFYDLFERPEFKERFADVSGRAKEQMLPQSDQIPLDKQQVHFVLAPLMLEKNVTAYWVLTAFGDKGAEILGEVAEQQWRLANTIAQCFYAEELVANETKHRKLIEMQLHKEKNERQVLQDVLSSMCRPGNSGLGEMCQKTGVFLGLADIGLYLRNKDSGKVESYYTWNQSGDHTAFFDEMEMTVSEYNMLADRFTRQEVLLADKESEEPFLRELIRKTKMAAIWIFPMLRKGRLYGYAVYAYAGESKYADSKDIAFLRSVTDMFENVIAAGQGAVHEDIVKAGYMDSYNHIRDAVVIKDNRSGDIAFANKAADKLFGYSVVGMRANDIINDQLENYRNVQGMRKRFITNNKVTKWQCYMKELDQIMNIVEVHLQITSNEDYSLFILKKNKNK